MSLKKVVFKNNVCNPRCELNGLDKTDGQIWYVGVFW